MEKAICGPTSPNSLVLFCAIACSIVTNLAINCNEIGKPDQSTFVSLASSFPHPHHVSLLSQLHPNPRPRPFRFLAQPLEEDMANFDWEALGDGTERMEQQADTFAPPPETETCFFDDFIKLA